MATIRKCPKCGKNRYFGNPIDWVWWWVMSEGLMCWHCYRMRKREKSA